MVHLFHWLYSVHALWHKASINDDHDQKVTNTLFQGAAHW